MKTIARPMEDMWELLVDPVQLSDAYSEQSFAAEWESLRDSLRKALGSKWMESCFGDADFSVLDDWSLNWYQAGGITSWKALVPEFLEIVAVELSKSPHPEKWGMQAGVCIESADGVEPIEGDMFVRNGTLYVAQHPRYASERLVQIFS